MLLHKLLRNKKIIIAAIALLLALCVGIVILVTSNTKETGGKNAGTKTEQSKDDADTTDDTDKTDADDKADDTADNESTDNSGHQILKPNEVAVDDSSDASGDWDEEEETEETDTQKDTTDDKAPEDEPEDKEPEDDIEEDDISWGEIY